MFLGSIAIFFGSLMQGSIGFGLSLIVNRYLFGFSWISNALNHIKRIMSFLRKYALRSLSAGVAGI